MRIGSLKSVILASAALCAGALPAYAQDSDTDDGAVERDEIVVTATRRAESLQDVPLTVTAFSAETLAEQRIVEIQRLVNNTPGVGVDTFPRVAPRAWFRGVGGSNQGAGADPSTVAFLDGVNLGRGPMLGVDMFDLERVEVLKGPQGTLWGRNVIGGAINYITARPEASDVTRLRVMVGDFGQRNVFGVLNRALTDDVYARFAVSSLKNDGFRTNLVDGGPLDEDDRFSARASFLFDWGPNGELILSADNTSDRTSGGARFNIAPQGSEDPEHPPTNAYADRPGYVHRDTGGLRAEYTRGLGFADLTALVGYRYVDFASSEDLDGATVAQNATNGLSVNALQVLMAEEAEAFSGELRLASTGDGPLSWVAGLYALREETTRDRETETAFLDTSENLYVGHNVTEHAAAFGEAAYAVTPALRLIAGLRYTQETKTYDVTRYVGDPAAPTINFSTVATPGETDENAWTYRIGADYDFSDDVMAYATISTGFKSGAFQEQPNAATARLATDPEEAINYEIGLKSEWFDGRLRVNAAAFHMDYSNLQRIAVISDLSGPPGSSVVITDTSDATIDGIEVDSSWWASENLQFNLSYTYLDATYGTLIETLQINADGSPLLNNSSGNQLTRTPTHKIVFGVAYETDDYEWGSLRAALNGNYESEVFDDSSNNLLEYRHPRTLLDASLEYKINETVAVTAWVNNLTDEVTRSHSTASAGGHFVQYGPPRQVGLTLDFDF